MPLNKENNQTKNTEKVLKVETISKIWGEAW